MELTREQQIAIDMIKEWYLKGTSQTFALSGYAGTGKSTVISMLAYELNIESKVVYATLTGKAAVVLNTKGVKAVTIHKLIYDVDRSSSKLSFLKKDDLEISCNLIVIDEFSMVNKQICLDLLSFGIKVLMVGDPGQLPPFGQEVGILSSPDFMLKQIVRQAKDSPIIQLSHMILNGFDLKTGSIGKKVLIVNRESIPDKCYLSADQILVGTNTRRDEVNRYVRSLLGKKDRYPETEEKLICVKNNWNVLVDEIPMINGTLGYAVESKFNGEFIRIKFRPDFTGESVILRADKAYFEGRKSKVKDKDDQFDKLEFGYAITVHKAQGSEFDNVLLIADLMHKEIRRRWLYTAVTRAKKGIIIGI